MIRTQRIIALVAFTMAMAAALACGSSQQPATVYPESTVEATADNSGGAGASGDTGGTAASGSLDACTILTADDAQTALGGPVNDTPDTSQSTDTDYSCIWNAQDGVQWVQVLIASSGSADEAASHYADLKKIADLDKATPVSGMGEDALYDPGLHWLIVKQGAYVFTFSAHMNSEDAIQAALTGIAPAVLARMP